MRYDHNHLHHRVGSHTTTKDSSPSNRKNEEDNVSGKVFSIIPISY